MMPTWIRRNHWKVLFSILVPLVAFSLPPGCAMRPHYKNPRLPKDQVVSVSIVRSTPHIEAHIVAVDGAYTGKTSFVDVRPGARSLAFVHIQDQGCVDKDFDHVIAFDAEAGHEYEIVVSAECEPFLWEVFCRNVNYAAINKTTGEVVAGMKPIGWSNSP
jgi:hypothetical protein